MSRGGLHCIISTWDSSLNPKLNINITNSLQQNIIHYNVHISIAANKQPQSRACAECDNRIQMSFNMPLVVALSLGKKESEVFRTDKFSNDFLFLCLLEFSEYFHRLHGLYISMNKVIFRKSLPIFVTSILITLLINIWINILYSVSKVLSQILG